MTVQNKFALPLAIALQVLMLSTAFGADGATDSASQQQGSNPSKSGVAATPANQSQSNQAFSHPKGAMPDAASVQKTQDTNPVGTQMTSAGKGVFTQSALSSIDEMVKADAPPGVATSRPGSNDLTLRMDANLAKAARVKAGTIDEQVREDGRREERVHTPGGEYCMTFESPSDPKDGIDKMQWGLHPAGMSNSASMHTCGHRFDQ